MNRSALPLLAWLVVLSMRMAGVAAEIETRSIPEYLQQWHRYTHEGTLVDGKKDGIWKVWMRLGPPLLLREESYRAGALDGPYLAYTSDGRLVAAINYREGKRHGSAQLFYLDGRSLLATYRDGKETARILLDAKGARVAELPVRAKPIVSFDNWEEFWERMDARAPKSSDKDFGRWGVRVVASTFADMRDYINPHLSGVQEGVLFTDLLQRFSHNACSSAGRGLLEVFDEIGCELSEAEKSAIPPLFTDAHGRRAFSSADGDGWDDYSANALLFHEFVDGLEKALAPENFALVAVFFESVYLRTRPRVGLEPRK